MKIIDLFFKAIQIVVGSLKILEIDSHEIIAIGICNQREATLLWNKKNGEVYNTIIIPYELKCIK